MKVCLMYLIRKSAKIPKNEIIRDYQPNYDKKASDFLLPCDYEDEEDLLP